MQDKDDALVDEASVESFPCSDPPSWTSVGTGAPRRAPKSRDGFAAMVLRLLSGTGSARSVRIDFPAAFASGAKTAGACALTMVVASTLANQAPWAGLNAMTNAFRSRRLVRWRFDAHDTPLGAGTVIAGVICLGTAHSVLVRAIGRRGDLLSGAALGVVALAIDRFLLSRALLPSFRRTMGTPGTMAKYGSIVLSAALTV